MASESLPWIAESKNLQWKSAEWISRPTFIREQVRSKCSIPTEISMKSIRTRRLTIMKNRSIKATSRRGLTSAGAPKTSNANKKSIRATCKARQSLKRQITPKITSTNLINILSIQFHPSTMPTVLKICKRIHRTHIKSIHRRFRCRPGTTHRRSRGPSFHNPILFISIHIRSSPELRRQRVRSKICGIWYT